VSIDAFVKEIKTNCFFSGTMSI